MSKLELRSYANRIMEIARSCLATDGHVQFIGFVLDHGGQFYPVEFSGLPASDADKDVVANALKSLAQRHKAVGMVNEMWLAAPTLDENMALVQTSQHPDRKEGIWVMMQSKKGTWTLQCTFERDAQGKPTAPSEVGAAWFKRGDGTFTGRFAELYQ